MSLRRVGGAVAMALAIVLWLSCGDVYRPVVIPTSTTPPNPANYHTVFGINANITGNYGTALQIDVSGDTNAGEANMGYGPTHAAILPNNSRVFVASAGSSQCPPQADNVISFTPAPDSPTVTGLGSPITFTMPNPGTSQSANIVALSEDGTGLVTATLSGALSNAVVGAPIEVSNVGVNGVSPYNGCFAIVSVSGSTLQFKNPTLGLAPTSGGIGTVPSYCPYLPDYVTTTQNTAVYVANYGASKGLNCSFGSTDSIATLNTSASTISKITYLPSGSHPVAMAETPNALNLYVINQGNDTVADLSPTDMSTIATIALPSGSMPAWAVSRPDSQRIYVVTQGDGRLYTIHTDTNAPDGGQSVGGPGANSLLYDKGRNRLYVTNPVAQAIYAFDATADPPALLASVSFAAGPNSPCIAGCTPVSVAALPDGSRFYVASYQNPGSCPDPTLGGGVACMIPMVTIFEAASFLVKPAASTLLPGSQSLSLLSSTQFSASQYAVPVAPSCVATGPYAPGQTRFRMFATAAADSSHVYVSICDAGAIADIVTTTSTIATGGNNTPDVLVTDITPAPAGCSGVSCGLVSTITGFQIASGVVTFAAANTFTAGQQVRISGLTSTTGALLDGQNLTVIATGLSGTQFACALPPNFTPSSAQQTADTGTAVPLPPPQAPIFLLTGQ